MNRATLRLLAGCAIALSLICGAACKKSTSAKDKITIAVIPKGTSHAFYKAVHAGALAAAADLSKAPGAKPIEIIWKGPLREDAREAQVQVVENFVASGVDAIVLSPLDERALVRPVEEAARLKIPTVVFDSALLSDKIVSFVATDNARGGHMAAKHMASLLNGRGKVMVLRYVEGSASNTAREDGFLAEIKTSFPNLEVISSDQYAGASREQAKQAAENLLNKWGSQINGIFAPNEPVTTGILLALQDRAMAGKVILVGFDSSPGLIKALKAQEVHGLVVQDPFGMGRKGVETAVAYLRGEKIPPRIETEVALVTKDNLETPPIAALLAEHAAD